MVSCRFSLKSTHWWKDHSIHMIGSWTKPFDQTMWQFDVWKTQSDHDCPTWLLMYIFLLSKTDMEIMLNGGIPKSSTWIRLFQYPMIASILGVPRHGYGTLYIDYFQFSTSRSFPLKALRNHQQSGLRQSFNNVVWLVVLHPIWVWSTWLQKHLYLHGRIFAYASILKQLLRFWDLRRCRSIMKSRWARNLTPLGCCGFYGSMRAKSWGGLSSIRTSTSYQYPISELCHVWKYQPIYLSPYVCPYGSPYHSEAIHVPIHLTSAKYWMVSRATFPNKPWINKPCYSNLKS